ncbi:beta-galactosidase [Rhodoferax sp.]|uniref:beta-galactosidase n=1 Tax=Rhodoferax sp. TaxID=50421 RepID=UPI00374D2929
MKLGVCYYPEHWSESWWEDDARRMVEVGIEYVRIAEFAWSRIEPSPGVFTWDWLDRAIATLHGAGLKVVMCTPTATPPKWLVDADPGMLAIDAHGQTRGFGSRRHYCFSSPSYRAQSARISTAVAERYGQHPAVVAWQTDNEYGCHNTVVSYSAAARLGFRAWLQQRYSSIAALNTAWGTVFWSQEYRNFDEVDPPVGTVTEVTPAQRLDYQRFASDEVVAFNRIQVDILRKLSPGRDVVHNYMGFFTEFDHHDLSADLDVATWDSYPLGFTQNMFLSPEEKRQYARVGHPDIPSFHHDLYRGMCKGRWWVMEQQPGPVNWAQWNPAPLDGMVRLWTWQAFAHGAEVVSYFRWRQAPFAQEQMHAGLNRPDRTLDQGGVEASQVFQELRQLKTAVPAGNAGRQAPVALVFDYTSIWMAQIQPQGADFNALELSFRAYSALRQMGLDVDILPSNASVDGYALVVLPAHMREDAALAARLANSPAQIVFGPRSGSKSEALAFPERMPPGAFATLAGVTVQRVASLPPGLVDSVHWNDGGHTELSRWREDLACTEAAPVAVFADNKPAVTHNGRAWYAAGWLDAQGWRRVLGMAAQAAGLGVQDLPADVRTSRRGELLFAMNFSNAPVQYAPSVQAQCLLGEETLAPQSVSIWKV